jgi:hypothetical protein
MTLLTVRPSYVRGPEIEACLGKKGTDFTHDKVYFTFIPPSAYHLGEKMAYTLIRGKDWVADTSSK